MYIICSPHTSALIPSSIIIQNPENKKEIICDEALSRVFGGESKVTMFSMHKVRIDMSFCMFVLRIDINFSHTPINPFSTFRLIYWKS